jgi:hypothetical protein
MPNIKMANDLSVKDITFVATCAALVTTYVGFALNARRQLKKSLEASNKQYEETSRRIAEAMDIVEQKKQSEN